jgi:RNA polymerase sigma factor for flagellar operon FliA
VQFSAQRDRLIHSHTDVARRIAMRMARRCPAHVAREDLIAAAMLGLIEAAERYDHSRREPFLSFAEHRIRGAVLDELRRGDLLPRRVRQLARKIASAMRELEKGGEPATEQRLADALGVPLHEVRRELADIARAELEPLDQERVADSHAQPDALADRQVALARVRAALAHIAPRDVTILGMHYVEDLTYQQIAEVLGITPSRVCQLLWRAVQRLRDQLGAPALQEAA